jgi:iron complex transport system substrate-binding protein
LEQVAAWDAYQIFIIAYNQDALDVTESLKSDPNWQALRAVRDGQLRPFPADLYSWDQPDTRWLLGLTWLGGQLHPDLFPALDITAEVQSFYQTLYGLDSAFFETNIRPTFKGVLP